ncbi:unnamed protein product [Mycena citricolor]|uniref:DAGKc domain-containing protein n=1 Tax=Mycena citricolor TaxID=2018698 RepID=A0AAD2GUZ3_9AGAR|nr:unnamed protein product [Mycena citricolor]
MFLDTLSGAAEDVENDVLDAWMDTLLHLAYHGIKRGRRIKVLVNPHSGTKKGAALFKRVIEPVLLAGHCTIDVTYTNGRNHGYEIAQSISLDFDAVAIVSGDGLVHEVLNGFAHHAQPRKAFGIPLVPIPAGTGNGLSLNILGFQDGFDIVASALNAVKGVSMKVDLFSMVQNGKRTISFMSQAIGLIADLDIGTEDLRWMGDARFTYGLLRGLIRFKPCPVKLSYKAAELDKDKMYDSMKRSRQNVGVPAEESEVIEDTALPPLQYSESKDGWTDVESPLLYVYAGKGPYVGRDFMAFPVSLPDDGLIDIVVQPLGHTSRSDILLGLAGAQKGELFWNDKVTYIKAHAYRITPLAPTGALSVDGEIFPFEEFQVETHKGLAHLLSPHGYYAADLAPRRS